MFIKVAKKAMSSRLQKRPGETISSHLSPQNGDTRLVSAFGAFMISANLRPLSDSQTTNEAIRLTRCELEALRLIALGIDSKTVASMLMISKRTVDTRLATVYAKLDVNNRLSAIQAALRAGLIPFER